MLNAWIFGFIILNLVKKGILDFYISTTTDICMKEVTDCWIRRALWRKTMETLKALILNHCTKFSKQSSFLFTILLYYRPLDIVQDSTTCSSFHK